MTMKQDQFSNLSILNSESDLTNSVDTKTIVDTLSETIIELVLV